MHNKIIIYPGTFDPITLGHMDLIERSLKIFDKVIIAVAQNSNKKTLFSFTERIDLIKQIFTGNKKIMVDGFTGLLVDFAKTKNCYAILRGLRVVSDFEYEFQMSGINRILNKDIETLFLTPSEKYAYISSSMVKEVAILNGSLTKFVDPIIQIAVEKKLSSITAKSS